MPFIFISFSSTFSFWTMRSRESRRRHLQIYSIRLMYVVKQLITGTWCYVLYLPKRFNRGNGNAKFSTQHLFAARMDPQV